MCTVAGDDATEATTKEAIMLWTIFVVLLVLWALGFVSGYAIGGFIHLLLVIAVVVLLIQLIQGRSSI
jgi:fatty acid desaturase